MSRMMYLDNETGQLFPYSDEPDIKNTDKCHDCSNSHRYPVQSPCWKCIENNAVSGKYYKARKHTNADHIRSMTDDELADFLDKTDPVYWTRDIWVNWLKEEWHES